MKVLSMMAHELSQEQMDDFSELNGEICQFKQLKDVGPSLYKDLVQCPAELEELEFLVSNTIELASCYDAVILPIGSPVFMFMLARDISEVECFFSHSERVSEEDRETGVKISKFKHIRFILVCT